MASKKLVIAAIGSSLRAGSVNAGLIRSLANQAAKYNCEVVSVPLDLPLFNSDLEADKAVPESVMNAHRMVASADAVVFSVAEYNYSVSGVMKNTIDWLSRAYLDKKHPLDNKPAAIMGAGGGMGTSRAQYHLRQILTFLNMHPLNKPEVFVQRWNDGGERFDKEGNVTDSRTDEKIDGMLAALSRWTRLIQAGEGACHSVECQKTVN